MIDLDQLLNEWMQLKDAIRAARQAYSAETGDQYDRVVYDRRCALARKLEQTSDALVQWLGRSLTTETLQAFLIYLQHAAPVVEAAKTWRDKKYPQQRSWLANCDEDMDLVSAIDGAFKP